MAEDVCKATIIVDQREWDPTRDIPNMSHLSFPFPLFWIECPLIGGIPTGAMVDVAKDGADFHVIAMCFANISPPRPTMLGAFQFRCNESGTPIKHNPLHYSPDGLPIAKDEIDADTPSIAMFGSVQTGEREFGVYAFHKYKGTTMNPTDAQFLAARDELTRLIELIGVSAADTMQLLGCKNVSLLKIENQPTGIPKQLARATNKPRQFSYHVLRVKPANAPRDSVGVDIGSMPRHVCRGHFAEYGPEFGKGLLFGKYAGRFYIPPHLKGKEENGIVEKDYVVS